MALLKCVCVCTCTASKKSAKEEKQPAKAGGGGWGFLGWIMPKKKNQVHLPDDKKPSVSFSYHMHGPHVSKCVN